MDYTKLRKMMNDIEVNTRINLDNEHKITNHSCRRTAIQMLKNNGLSDSDLQSFFGHRSRESLADYCKTSDDQQISNTAMLIPFSLDECNLSSNKDTNDEKCKILKYLNII